jgi:hypothetical protein
MGLGAVGYGIGKVTDARDESANVERLKQEQGILPDSLKLGNRTFDLKKFQSIATPIIAGARLMQGNGKDALTSALDATSGAFNMFTDMSMVQGVPKLADLLTSSDAPNAPDKGKIILDLIMTLPKQYIPQIVKKMTYALDPFERNLKDDNSIKYSTNQVTSKIPFASKNFPPKVDVNGNPVETYDGNNNIINTMFNPYVSKKLKNDSIGNEALRLNKNVNDSELKNGVIPKAVSKNLGDVKLSIRQQNDYQKILGDETKTRIDKLLKDSNYADMKDEEKAILFSSAIDEAIKTAKATMEEKLNIDTEEIKRVQKEKSNNKKNLLRNFGIK